MGWKLPPRIKVMEALGAVAGNRVHLLSPQRAEVSSPGGHRKYKVIWKPAENAIFSDDNGSVHRGYLGYPAIAVLMVLGELPYDMGMGRRLVDVPWARLNQVYNNYRTVIYEVTKNWTEGERDRLDKFVDWVLSMIKSMELEAYDPSTTTLNDFVGNR